MTRRDGRGRFAPKQRGGSQSEQVGEVDPRGAGQRPADQTDDCDACDPRYGCTQGCDEPHEPPPSGCMVPILIVLMLSVIAFLIYDRHRSPAVAPQPAPAVVPATPVGNTAAFVEPIRVKLAGDRAKAAIVADAYLGFGAALAGKSGQRVVDSRTLEAVQKAYLTDVDALGGVAVGTEIDAAIGGYLGMTKTTGKDGGWEPIAFNESHRVKLVEIVNAIAEAARSVK